VERVRVLEGERARYRDKARGTREQVRSLEEALAQLDRLSRY